VTQQRNDIRQIQIAQENLERLLNTIRLAADLNAYRNDLLFRAEQVQSLLANYHDSINTPFSQWLRQNPRLDSVAAGLSITDIDLVIHQYLTTEGAYQTRFIQHYMLLEEKRYGRDRPEAQLDTQMKLDQLLREVDGRQVRDTRDRTVTMRYFGFHVVTFSGSGPADSDVIRWNDHVVTLGQLEQLLCFELDPRTLQPRRPAAAAIPTPPPLPQWPITNTTANTTIFGG
jgi:hypothetical protein